MVILRLDFFGWKFNPLENALARLNRNHRIICFFTSNCGTHLGSIAVTDVEGPGATDNF
jgi:hypothetical protein